MKRNKQIRLRHTDKKVEAKRTYLRVLKILRFELKLESFKSYDHCLQYLSELFFTLSKESYKLCFPTAYYIKKTI